MSIVKLTPLVFGEIEGTSLTGTFAEVLAVNDSVEILILFCDCDQDVEVSLDGGTTSHFKLADGDSFPLNFASNRAKLDISTIEAKHSGAAPTAGSIRATVFKHVIT